MQSTILGANGKPLKRTASSGRQAYQAGGQGRRMRGWLASGSGPTDAAVGNAQTLRNRSRHQYRNDPWGRSGINKLVSNIIGTGIRPRWDTGDKAFDTAAQSLWKEWTAESDPEGQLGFYGQQAQAVNSMLQGAESFLRMRPRRASDGLTVPLQVQLLESEMCPEWYSGYNGGNVIRAGIEFDPIGRRAAYYFWRNHPGDSQWLNPSRQDLVRVPAREVVHLFDPVRPGQIRGIVQMAPVLLRMYDLDKFDDATLLRQEIANLWAAFVTNNTGEAAPVPTHLNGEDGESTASDELDSLGMEPGLVQELLEGQGIEFSNPPGPASTYAEFLRQQLMAVAAGLEVPYEVLTGDFSKINDRTARVLLNEFRRRVQQMQTHIAIHQMCRGVQRYWTDRAVLAGKLTAPDYAANQATYKRCKWVPQAWAYIHPEQDVNAYRKARRAGIKTLSQIISESTGEDIDDVMDHMESENAEFDRRGLIFDSDPRRTDQSGGRAEDVEPDEDDEAEASRQAEQETA